MTTAADRQAFENAALMVKVQGIISIVFGGLGVLGSLFMLTVFAIRLVNAYVAVDVVLSSIFFICTVLFVLLPHAYLVIAGIVLVREPEPRMVKVLTIINIVFGALLNYVVLVFAIISLVQSGSYKDGYHLKK